MSLPERLLDTCVSVAKLKLLSSHCPPGCFASGDRASCVCLDHGLSSLSEVRCSLVSTSALCTDNDNVTRHNACLTHTYVYLIFATTFTQLQVSTRCMAFPCQGLWQSGDSPAMDVRSHNCADADSICHRGQLSDRSVYSNTNSITDAVLFYYLQLNVPAKFDKLSELTWYTN
eukprot:6210571-Pleurochrysis_carterae.AAC.2